MHLKKDKEKNGFSVGDCNILLLGTLEDDLDNVKVFTVTVMKCVDFNEMIMSNLVSKIHLLCNLVVKSIKIYNQVLKRIKIYNLLLKSIILSHFGI